MGLFNLQSRHIWLFMLLFAIGATSRFDLTLFARVPLSEVLAFGLLPFVLKGVPLARFSHRIWPVVGILLLWVLGIVISDFVNGFSGGRFIRAFAKPVWCFLWMLFFIGVLHKDFRALLFYPVGTILASIQNYIAPQDWTAYRIEAGGYEAVAYGLAPLFSALCLTFAVALYRKGRLFATFFFGVNTVILALAGAPRSSVGIALLSGIVFIYIWWTRRAGGKVYRLSVKRVIGLGILCLIALFGIFEAYKYAAVSGFLGDLQQMKLMTQSQTILGDSFLGLVASGRTPVFGAILAIMDNPLFGTGSWTSWMMSGYYYEAVALVGTSAAELERFAQMGQMPGIGHSIFFAAWLENGIIAAMALSILAYILLKELLLVVQQDSRLAPLLVYFGISFFWAFLFSPFGVSHRMIIGLFLAFHVMRFHQLSTTTPHGLPPAKPV